MSVRGKDFEGYLDDFHTYNCAKNLADGTKRIYNWGLRCFYNWFDGTHGAEAEVTARTIRAFMTWQMENGLSPKSVRMCIKTLRTFYNFLVMEEVVPEMDNPMRRVPNPRVPFQQVVPLSPKQVRDFLATFNKKRLTEFRDYVACVLILDSGLRASEVLGLTLEAVNFDNLSITIVGKGAKQRTVYMGQSMKRLLEDYLRRCWPWIADGHDILFPTLSPVAKGPRITVGQFSAMVGRKLDYVGVPRCHSAAHRLRHTFATTFLRNDGNVFALQKLLGHSSLEMTKRYVMLSTQDVAKEHRKASPVDALEL